MDKNYIDMTDYDGVPEYTDHCPDCPECGTTMGYNYYTSEFKCPSCGYIMDEYDWDRDDEDDPDEIPYGCRACGGPWPNCKTACKLYDD